MARKKSNRSQVGGQVRRAAASVKRIITPRHPKHETARQTAAGGRTDTEQPIVTNREHSVSQPPRPARHSRPARRESDISLESIEREYLPMQTGLKSPFRSDGADMQRDQEFAEGAPDERWNDEDRFTNRSGDPRIGTHGRSYEPGEENRDDKE